MPHPQYKGKPIFALVDQKNHRGLEQVFEDVAEDKQMNDEQQQQQVSTETKAERKLRLKKAQLKKHMAEQELEIKKCKYLNLMVSQLA